MDKEQINALLNDIHSIAESLASIRETLCTECLEIKIVNTDEVIPIGGTVLVEKP